MSSDGAQSSTMSVAVAVKGGGGGLGGRGSRRAVRWAVENLLPKADRFVLVHVIPITNSIPTPSGDHIPIEQLDSNVVTMYVEDKKVQFEEIFLPFKKLCKTRKIETMLLEGDNPAASLVRYISDLRINSLVLGSCSSNCIIRKLKAPGIPSTVLKHAPPTCDIYVVSRHRLMTNSVDAFSTSVAESNSKHWLFNRREHGSSNNKLPFVLYSSSVESKVQSTSGKSSITDVTCPNFQALMHESSLPPSCVFAEGNHKNFGGSISETETVQGCTSLSSEQSDVQAEVEKLHQELHNIVSLYNQACEDLVHAQNKVHLLSSDCREESRKVNAALKREENFRKIAAEENEKHLEAVKEVEIARNMLAKEAYERQIAELKALKESLEKQRIVDALFLSDRRYKRYSKDEIEVATDFFSDSKVIGEGAYGKVYKGNLDHTPVAIKVLRPDASNKTDEFLREIEVLSQLRHPNIVLLLGACPDSGSLVYEYMENGSLDNLLFYKSDQYLHWVIRFQIVFEVACGLAFLHNSKPKPIVHRDIKPGNILLDRNYVTKIGDVGLAKLVTDVVPDNITEYNDSILSGTLFYMDPEYQRTGTVRPKSDLYGFGIIILQLLTARHPNGLLLMVENAIESGSLMDILDKSVTDWPSTESLELAQMALKCSSLRCRDRPDLDTEVLPVMKKLADFADSRKGEVRKNTDAPNHFICPILQKVMDDPHIAADGFTYEHKAIKLWLERHNVSPVTKIRLQHKMLTPNHTLHSAIQEWRRDLRT